MTPSKLKQRHGANAISALADSYLSFLFSSTGISFSPSPYFFTLSLPPIPPLSLSHPLPLTSSSHSPLKLSLPRLLSLSLAVLSLLLLLLLLLPALKRPPSLLHPLRNTSVSPTSFHAHRPLGSLFLCRGASTFPSPFLPFLIAHFLPFWFCFLFCFYLPALLPSSFLIPTPLSSISLPLILSSYAPSLPPFPLHLHLPSPPFLLPPLPFLLPPFLSFPFHFPFPSLYPSSLPLSTVSLSLSLRCLSGPSWHWRLT